MTKLSLKWSWRPSWNNNVQVNNFHCLNEKNISVNCIFYHNFVDKTRQECHDATITEMGTETIMEQQCTGKVISISVTRKKYPLNLIFNLS